MEEEHTLRVNKTKLTCESRMTEEPSAKRFKHDTSPAENLLTKLESPVVTTQENPRKLSCHDAEWRADGKGQITAKKGLEVVGEGGEEEEAASLDMKLEKEPESVWLGQPRAGMNGRRSTLLWRNPPSHRCDDEEDEGTSQFTANMWEDENMPEQSYTMPISPLELEELANRMSELSIGPYWKVTAKLLGSGFAYMDSDSDPEGYQNAPTAPPASPSRWTSGSALAYEDDWNAEGIEDVLMHLATPSTSQGGTSGSGFAYMDSESDPEGYEDAPTAPASPSRWTSGQGWTSG